MLRPATALLVLAGILTISGSAAAPDFQLQKAGNGIWAAIVSDAGLAGGNAGFVIGDDGVLVIDTFQDPRPAKVLLSEIRKLTPLPIRFVVNTHYHLDHVNGNDSLRRRRSRHCGASQRARLDAHRKYKDAGSSRDGRKEGARRIPPAAHGGL
jgi:glyoxylase-like metal-dependent hydrolase (beta-lactamase superfamily II)